MQKIMQQRMESALKMKTNEKAFTILEIQKQLRHKDPATTTRFYIRDRSGKSAIVDKVNATPADPRMEKAIEALNMAV